MNRATPGRCASDRCYPGRLADRPRPPTLGRAMPRMVRLAVPFAAVALVLGAAALGSDWEATGRPLPRAERVVVLGIPRLDWRDLDEGRAPALRRLALQKGAAGTLSARAAATVPEPVEGYATLGAGSRLKGIPEAASAVERGGGVEVPAARALARKQRGRHLPTGPGALGDALHRAGIRTAVVGAGAAAVAAMDRTGRIDAGALGRVDLGAARGARFVVVDPGDMERVERFKDLEDPARTRAIRRADALAGRLAATLPP